MFNLQQKTMTLHRCIALSFIPNPNNLREVNHKNGIKTDNRLENLEWVSSSQNRIHAFKNGLQENSIKSARERCGEKSYYSKLTEDSVRKMRELRLSGRTIISISKEFKIGKSAAAYAINGHTWKHVKE